VDPFPPQRSPDGRIEVRFNAYEARMSHWILEPDVVRLRDGAVVLSLGGTAWDGGGVVPTFPAPDRVELHLRHYPDGSKTFSVVVDVEAERCWLAGAEDRAVAPSEVERLLAGRRERHVQHGASEQVMRGFCPECGAQLYGAGPLGRLRRRREVQCLVCERRWQVPPGARLF
jgi:hypothetical protein